MVYSYKNLPFKYKTNYSHFKRVPKASLVSLSLMISEHNKVNTISFQKM